MPIFHYECRSNLTMTEPFFGVDSNLPALGAGKYESLEAELLTDDVEDEYDALNDETFGGDLVANDDWEDDHNKFSQLDAKSKLWNSSISSHNEKNELSNAISSLDKVPNKYANKLSSGDDLYSGQQDENEIEQSISQLLILDDELDDPAIVDVGKVNQKKNKRSYYNISPPPPAIIESDNVGSPSTSTIWTSAYKSESNYPSLLQNLQTKQLKKADLSLQDPSIIGIEAIPPKCKPKRVSPVVHTLEEIESKLLEYPDIPAGAKTVEEIERDLASQNQINGLILSSTQHNFRDRSRPVPINRRSSPISTIPLDVGLCISPPTFSLPMSSPLGTPPKLGMSPGSILIPPFRGRFVPPQVGFQQPLIVPRSQAFLGQPLLFPGGRMSPPNHPMFNQRSRFAYPVRYVDPYQRIVPNVHHPLLGINQPRPNLVQRPARPQVPFQRRPSASNGEIDEYANLMSAKEKEWLIKIQLLQLQTSNPYLDDYYYTSYLMKQKALEKNREGDTEGEEPKLLLPELTKTETRTYTPEQYEGSLGKLQAVSVNYPRKIIDLEILHPEDIDGENTTNKDLRKFRQALLEIEKLYSIFLTIDDTDKKILALPKESHVPLEESKRTAIVSIFNAFSNAVATDDKFFHIMGIRKGRNLILRCFVLFSKVQRRTILLAVLKYFTPIMKKASQDQSMWNFLIYFRDMINDSNLEDLVEIGLILYNQGENTISNINKSHFVYSCQSKFGLTMLALIFERAENLFVQTECKENLKEKWIMIISHFVHTLTSLSDEVIPHIGESVKLIDFLPHFHRFSHLLKHPTLEKKLKLAFSVTEETT